MWPLIQRRFVELLFEFSCDPHPPFSEKRRTSSMIEFVPSLTDKGSDSPFSKFLPSCTVTGPSSDRAVFYFVFPDCRKIFVSASTIFSSIHFPLCCCFPISAESPSLAEASTVWASRPSVKTPGEFRRGLPSPTTHRRRFSKAHVAYPL